MLMAGDRHSDFSRRQCLQNLHTLAEATAAMPEAGLRAVMS